MFFLYTRIVLNNMGIYVMGVVRMSRTSKISSVTSSRIHSSYVYRSKTVNKSSMVEGVGQVSNTSNQTAYSSGNYLFYSDAFYESLKNFKEEYKKFYYDQRELERKIINFDYGDNLLNNLIELVKSYNLAINSLKSFDRFVGTKHLNRIGNTLETQAEIIKSIGIVNLEGYELKLDESKLVRAIEQDELEVVKIVKNLIETLNKDFKTIKVNDSLNYDLVFSYIIGLSVDDKS